MSRSWRERTATWIADATPASPAAASLEVDLSDPSATPVVHLRDVRVRYGDARVLAIDELSVAAREEVAVIGPSGSGKTTLLRLINGYVPWTGGAVEVLGHRFESGPGARASRGDRELRRRIGFVFQGFNLVERASVYANVRAGRLGHAPVLSSLLGRFSHADRDAALAAIEEVELGPQLMQRADTLSGGQQQRVGVARAVAQEPDIVLADEPVSNLDPRLVDEILELLVEVVRHHRATLLMTLHQPALARRFARRVIGLRAGAVAWDGDAADLDSAAIEAIYGERIDDAETQDPAAESSALTSEPPRDGAG